MIDLTCAEDRNESAYKSGKKSLHGNSVACVNVFQSQEEERMQTFTKAWMEVMNHKE